MEAVKYEVIMSNDSNPMSLSSYLLVLRNRSMIEGVPVDPVRGIVLLDAKADKCFQLGHPGTRIWELIGEPTTVGCVVDRLLEEYAVDRLTCESQVFSFFATLSEQGLIQFGI